MNYLMIKESRETPDIVHRKVTEDRPLFKSAAAHIQQKDPQFLVSIARGSSDHGASFINYLISARLGLVSASLPPSLVTLHGSKLNFHRSLALAISQSGASPDICAALESAGRGGASTLAFINQPGSPLGDIAECVIPIGAGREEGIAATKTFIATLVSGMLLVAEWQRDQELSRDLQGLPQLLEAAMECDWSESLGVFEHATSLLVLSRGLGLSIAQEAALKLNEVCRLHALAYSTAEFHHGPIALIRKGDPVLVIGVRGPELSGMQDTVQELRTMGANVVFIAPEGTSDASLTYPKSHQPLFDPIVAIQALYPFLAQVAVTRGLNPDEPFHLRKVTKTL